MHAMKYSYFISLDTNTHTYTSTTYHACLQCRTDLEAETTDPFSVLWTRTLFTKETSHLLSLSCFCWRCASGSSVQECCWKSETGQIEIKHGSMQFDSHLIIISCNTPPRQMAVSFGWECVEAMYHRFEDPPASG